MGFFNKLKTMFQANKSDENKVSEEQQEEVKVYEKGLSKSREGFVSKLANLTNKYRTINDDYFDELEEILIMADIGVNTVIEFIDRLKDRTVKKEEYQGLYFKFDERIRQYLKDLGEDYTKPATIRQMPGYEMLRIAWIAWKVDNNLTEESMLETIEKNLSLRTAKVQVEDEKNSRDPILQKMIEVIRSLGEDVSPLKFVREL